MKSYWVTTLLLPAVTCWHLNLLHVNDIHSRMEETNKYSSKCRDKDRVKGKCYGGLARMYTAVEDIKHNEDNVLWLNAGDFYQGTVWYTQFKWSLVSQFNNLLNFSALTLGNHEFDDRLEGIEPFLKTQTSPVVVTNLNSSMVPQLKGLYQPSIIIEVGSRRVGIVGYLTPSTVYSSRPPPGLIINDEIEALKKEVEKLHNDGVDIIVALGHSGYVKDVEIAERVPNVDIVVGAHSHDFLFTVSDKNRNPSNNPIRGPYPTVVQNIAGHRTLVVQAFAFTKYLGKIRVEFDDFGVVNHWLGMPILLDKNIKKNEKILQALEPWKNEMNVLIKKVVGITTVYLEKGRDKETNLGTLATEAMVWSYRNKIKEDGTKYRLAMINSGGLRANAISGNLTLEDLLEILPFESTFDTVTISGKCLKETFEHSVSTFNSLGQNYNGRFLQVGGFQLVFDVRNPVGQRLELAKFLSEDGYKDIEDEDYYDVITNSYIAAGGDGYTCCSEQKLKHQIGPLDTDVIKEYLELKSPIHPQVQGTIVIKSTSTHNPTKIGYYHNYNQVEAQNSEISGEKGTTEAQPNCWQYPLPFLGLDLSIRLCGWSLEIILD